MTVREELRKLWRLASAPLRAMPSFVLAGAPKCGTSTLYDCIAEHPRVRRGLRKEPTNFVHYPGSRLRAAANYPFRLSPFLTGDGSVEYFAHPEGPKNVRQMLPEARLIFILRDPVKRAWSDYQMYLQAGMDRDDFSVTVERAVKWLREPEMEPLVEAAARKPINPVRYVLCGMYARLLERWFAEFPREQCLVLFTEEFARDRDGELRRVFEHIGLDPVEIPVMEKARAGGYSSRMPEATERKLREFFIPQDARLEGLLNRELPWR